MSTSPDRDPVLSTSEAAAKATRSAASRRGFLSGVAVTAGAVMLPGSGLLNRAYGQEIRPYYGGQPPAVSDDATDGPTQLTNIPGRTIDEQVLNYALTLEHLEADLYRQALNRACGLSLNTPLASDRSSYTRTAGNGTLSTAAAAVGFDYLKIFAYVEAEHARFIRAALYAGGGPAVAPNPAGYQFPSLGTSISDILGAILPLEETGVRAYLGALPYMTDLGLATVAAGIYSTEARHSAVIAALLSGNAGPAPQIGDRAVVADQPSPNTFEYFLTPQQVFQAAGVYFL